jgi:hypothetical protein
MTRRGEVRVKGLVSILALAAVVLLAGCTTGTGGGEGTAKTLTWAQQIADDLADAWNPAHKVTAIFGLWVDEDGELDEAPDNPVWGLFYTSNDDSEGYGVLVHDDGHTDSGEGPPPAVTTGLGDYSTEDVEDWMQTATEEMAGSPDPLDAYDYIVAVAYSELFDSDIAAVYFFEESDKDTDYDVGSWNPDEYFSDYYALVILDAETDFVLFRSGD